MEIIYFTFTKQWGGGHYIVNYFEVLRVISAQANIRETSWPLLVLAYSRKQVYLVLILSCPPSIHRLCDSVAMGTMGTLANVLHLLYTVGMH